MVSQHGRVIRIVGSAAASALAAAVACAQDVALPKSFDGSSVWRETEAAVRLAGGLKLKANAQTLREGEALTLSVELPRAGYLNVISIDADGTPTVLFPNKLQSDNKVEAGRFTLPGGRMNFELRAAAPFGPSLVSAVLTSEPLNLYANGAGPRDAAGALLGQFAQLSGVGRDLLGALGARNLVASPARPSMSAGMTTVLSCAKTGPCQLAPPSTGSRIVLRILDALAPGIQLDPQVQDKAIGTMTRPLRPVDPRGLRLTKVSEGFVGRLYEDAAGYCTIAYGHLLQRDNCGVSEWVKYPRGINEPGGSRLLVTDMSRAQRAVQSLVTATLTDGQFAALVDFTYNVGAANLKKSTLLKVVNSGQHERVPSELKRWANAGGRFYQGLLNRRRAEIALFFDQAEPPKPTAKEIDLAPVDIRDGESAP